jgi:hypothetical protein
MHDPIAYKYEADYHCEACALAAFGRDEHGDITGEDGEGNPVGIVAPWDEWIEPSEDGPQTLACGTCGEVIEEYEGDA